MKPGIQNITFELKRDRGLPSKCELVNRRGGEGGGSCFNSNVDNKFFKIQFVFHKLLATITRFLTSFIMLSSKYQPCFVSSGFFMI